MGQITRGELLERFRKYRKLSTQVDIQQYVIRGLEAQVARIQEEHISATQLTGVALDVPKVHSSRRGSLVEKLALEMDECAPEITAKIRKKREDLDTLERKKEQLDIMLNSLNEREQLVIRNHLIMGRKWRDVVILYEKNFGEPLLEGALKAIQTQALDKLLWIAEELEA